MNIINACPSEDDPAEDEVDKLEAEFADRVFVLSEVLKIAAKLDYTDEIGRRKPIVAVQVHSERGVPDQARRGERDLQKARRTASERRKLFPFHYRASGHPLSPSLATVRIRRAR